MGQKYVTAMWTNVLRIASGCCGVAAWLISYTYLFHIIGPYADTCTQGDDFSYQISLLLCPGTLLATAGGVWLSAPFRRSARWLLVPHVPAAVVAVPILCVYLWKVTFLGAFICRANSLSDIVDTEPCWDETCAVFWHRIYAPIILASILIFWMSALRFFRIGAR